MIASSAELVVGKACRSWAAGNLPILLSFFLEDAVFAVHACENGASFVGEGLSRALLGYRLAMLLDQIEVLTFESQPPTTNGIWVHSRSHFVYRHRASGLIIDGTMRHKWRLVGGAIAHLEIFYDAPRMRAFYELARLEACNA